MLAKNRFFVFLFVFFLWGSKLLSADTVRIATMIEPLSDLARAVAGEGHEVKTILPPGANPHTFELSPKFVKELDGIKIIFVIGEGFDDWLRPVLEQQANKQLIPVHSGIRLLPKDPHYWLSIQNAKLIAQNIARALSEQYPENKRSYETNLIRLMDRLNQTDSEIRLLLAQVRHKEMITFHDSWNYFANDYGLKVVATVEASEAAEPRPKRLAKMSKLVQTYHIKSLFTEPPVNVSLARTVAGDLGLKVYELDPLGFKDEKADYPTLVLANAKVILEGLRS